MSTDLRKLIAQYHKSALMLIFMSTCIGAIWWRNHDILRDMFDYSGIMSVGGKIEAGFKPFSYLRSPVQSATYLFNYATEQVFGRTYLGLTMGGLVQAWGGALLLVGLLHRRLGMGVATFVALAVALAGLLQHVVFFYNTIGVLCFSVVVLGLALEPELWPVRSWRTVAVFSALFVGGINKLSFHGVTLGLAGLLTLAAWAQGRINRAAVARNALLLLLLGCVVPLAFELAWTGATFSQWFGDVVLLPAARRELLAQIHDLGIYVRPAYDFHHHVPLRAIGGIGLGLLLVTGGWLLWDAVGQRRLWTDWFMRFALVIAGWAGGALLMITNFEAVMLTSLAYPVLVTALYLLYRRPERSADRAMGRMVLGAALCWSICGGYAAWHGSRVLYAPNPPPRSAYVRLHSTSRALAYLEGVRMLPDQIDALERVAARLRSLEDPAGKLHGVLFGPALEWLERAYPEAIVRGESMWYGAGVVLRENDAGYFKRLLGDGTSRLITYKGWQAWPAAIREMLARDYRQEPVGSRDVLYHPRGPAAPVVAQTASDSPTAVEFRGATGSNVMITATRSSPGMFIQPAATGAAYGANRDTSWSWPFGANDAQGQAVARLDSAATSPGVVTFRIMAGDPDNGEIILEQPVHVSPQRREVVVPLKLQPGGRPLWFVTVISDAAQGAVFGGWREMRITYTAQPDRSPALPYGKGLQRVDSPATPDGLWFGRNPAGGQPGAWTTVPAENWRQDDGKSGLARVAVEFEPNPGNPADPVVVTLAWYRAGRFEIMTEKMIDLRTVSRVTLEAPVTEPGGWVGLLTRPADGEGAGHRMRIVSWQND